MYLFPKEIDTVIKKIENKGFKVYLVGGSIRDLILGNSPADWDLATDCDVEKLTEILGDSIVDSPGKEYGVLKLKEGNLELELSSLRLDSGYKDYRRPDEVNFIKDVSKDLTRRDFTINAIAYHRQEGIIDPYDGRKDIKEKLIRTVRQADESFQEDPLRILRGIRLAGQLDFDIEMETFESMAKNSHLLEKLSVDRRRIELERLLMGKNTGKALRMLMASGSMAALFGHAFPPKKQVENGDLETLVHNIDRSRKDVDLRLALLLLCFEKRKAKKVIEDLNLSKKRKTLQLAAQDLLTDLYFATDKYSLKRFIYINGTEIYEFLNNLSKQQREVYETPGYRIESRYYILEDMKMYKEPIFIEDLVISGKDLIDAGIVAEDKAGEMLKLLIDVVHRFPGLNTEEKLLKKAKALRNPIRAKLRNIYMVR